MVAVATAEEESNFKDLAQAVLSGGVPGESSMDNVPFFVHVLLQTLDPSVQQRDELSPKDSVSSSPVGVVHEGATPAPPGHGLPLTIVAD
jgi:hypothetical protein